MKFKYLIILFSIIIVIIILVTALLPVLLTGPVLMVDFWNVIMPVMVFMVLLLVSVIIFFLFNYRLLSLLDREDWPALSYYLEQKIFVKGRYSARKVRLLASSYLVISDFASVLKLESKVLLAKPSIINKYVLIFGAARVLVGNPKGAADFFKTYLEKGKAKDRQWIHWFYGFSHLLNGSFNLAEPEFKSLAISSDDILITGLSAYFLNCSVANYSLKPEECLAIAENGRSRVIKTLKTQYNWKKEAAKTETDIHIVIIKKYIDEAGDWLFMPPPKPEPELEPEIPQDDEEGGEDPPLEL